MNEQPVQVKAIELITPRAIAVLVAVSVVGSLAHNVMEFGWAGLIAAETFSVPWVLIWAALAFAWWKRPSARTPLAWTMLALALLNVIGGAVISVLPLSFVPFDPEQSAFHYSAHVIYGIAQLPLVWTLATRLARG